jgi:hypothetical protein
VHMVERKMIEGRRPEEIAAELRLAFDRYCSRPGPSIPAEEFVKLDFVSVCGSSIPRY